MGKVLAFPAKTSEEISRFIREESEAGRCAGCAEDIGREDGKIVVCDSCRATKDHVRCARCGTTHVVKRRYAKKVCPNIIDDMAFLDLTPKGPIVIVVGACIACDPEGILERVSYKNLKEERLES